MSLPNNSVTNLERQRLQGNIWKFYLFEMLGALLFAVPIIVLFWQENGLSLTQIMILQSVFSLTMVVLEVPTGYLADLYGRKKLLLLSGISFLIALCIYSIAFDFITILAAELFFALALCCYSGTSSAFVYDTLVELGQAKTYGIIWGKAKYYGLLAMACAHIIGGFVGAIQLRWTLYLSIPFYAALIPLALSLHEPKRHKLVIEKSHFHKLVNIVKFSVIENVQLRWLIIFAAIIYAFNSAGLWLYQPYFQLSGLAVVYFGIVFAAFHIVAAISARYAQTIEKKLGKHFSLVMLVPIIVITYALTSQVVVLWSYMLILPFQFVRGFSETLLSDYTNALTTSDRRASVLSLQSLASRLAYAMVIPVVGWLADVYSITQTFLVIGMTTLFVGAILLAFLYAHRIFNTHTQF